MQPSKPPTLHYQTLLLAMWQESTGEVTATQLWRFSLTDPHTMHRVGFRNLEELVGYLEGQIAESQQVIIHPNQ